MLGHLFLAGRAATDALQGEISIQVPVNMRKFYPSKTVRNFALYCGIRIPVEEVRDLPTVLREVDQQLQQKASKAAMGEMLTATEKLVNAIRYIPLAVKGPAARVAYNFLGDKIFSNTLSNLGLVRLPPAMQEQVESMDFVLGTAITNRAGCGLVTVGDTATLSIAKMTADPRLKKRYIGSSKGRRSNCLQKEVRYMKFKITYPPVKRHRIRRKRLLAFLRVPVLFAAILCPVINLAVGGAGVERGCADVHLHLLDHGPFPRPGRIQPNQSIREADFLHMYFTVSD